MVYLAAARYGKDLVRIFRIVRNADGTQDVAEYTVTVLLEGDIETSYTESDNTVVVTTDSCKNITREFAKKSPYVLQPEKFALELGMYFVTKYAHIHKCHIDIIKFKWSRIAVKGVPHKHSFVRDGEDKRFTNVTIDATKGKKSLTATVQSGIKDLLVLKSSGSSFENFVVDEHTTLKPVDDRIFSTAVDCTYKIPIVSKSLTPSALASLGIDFEKIFKSVEAATLETFATHNSASVQATIYQMCERILAEEKHVADVTYKLPNKHYFAVDMSYRGIENLKPSQAEVFEPVAAPSGLIIATVARGEKAKL